MTALPRLAIVGTGAVARALGLSYRAAGGTVAVVISRDAGRAAALGASCGAPGSADAGAAGAADVVLVCVPDGAVPGVGARLAAALGDSGPVVLHTSGALPSSALRAASPGPGAPVLRTGSLHPLQSFPAGAAGPEADRRLAASVAGIHWFHEGDGEVPARALVSAWDGRFHALTTGAKVLYHAGAAMVSNHAVALFADATRLLAAAGVAPGESRAALATLLEGTAANLRAVGVPDALTGPVARGDGGTVRRHVEALRLRAPELLDAYRAMARRAIVVALEKGTIDAAAARDLDAALG